MKIHLNKFLTDIISLSSSRVIGMALSILSGILLTRLLGPTNKGIVATLLVLPGLIITFSNLGVRQATTYFLGKKIYKDADILATVAILLIFTSALSVGIAAISYIAGGYLKLYEPILLLIPIVLIPIKLFISYGNGILLGKKKIPALSLSEILHDSAFLILVGLIYFIPKSLHTHAALAAYVLAAAVSSVYILSLLPQIGKIKPEYIAGLPWAFIKKGFLYAIALFILDLNYRVDILILGRVSSVYEVGIYSVGVGFADLLWLLPNVLTMVNFSHSADANDALLYARKTARILRLTLWVAILPALALYAASPWLIPFIYGNEFSASGLVVRGILPGVWMMLIFKILNSDLAGRGHPQAALWVYGISAIINIILNIWWDPIYGAVGAAWASSVSYSVGAILFLLTYAKISALNFTELIFIKKSDFAGVFRR